jgi:hypothetical protein
MDDTILLKHHHWIVTFHKIYPSAPNRCVMHFSEISHVGYELFHLLHEAKSFLESL